MAQYLEHAKRRLDVKHVVGIKEGYLLFEYMWSIYLSIGISTKWENSKIYLSQNWPFFKLCSRNNFHFLKGPEVDMRAIIPWFVSIPIWYVKKLVGQRSCYFGNYVCDAYRMSYSHFNLKTLISDTLYICGYLILSQVKVLLSLLWSLLKGDTENPTIIP